MNFLFICAFTVASAVALNDVEQGQQRAKAAEFPYQAVIRYGNFKVCGGVLIGHEWVLTSASCAARAANFEVLLDTDVMYTAKLIHKVTKSNVFVHPTWRRLENNIAAIKIPYTNFTDNMMPVKLPFIAASYPKYVGQEVVASGYAKAKFQSDPHLYKLHLHVLSNDKCQQNVSLIFKPTYICADTSKNFVHYLSGEPLVLASNNALIGLLNFGPRNDYIRGYPASYTRVTSYLDWIEETTGIYDIDDSLIDVRSSFNSSD